MKGANRMINKKVYNSSGNKGETSSTGTRGGGTNSTGTKGGGTENTSQKEVGNGKEKESKES